MPNLSDRAKRRNIVFVLADAGLIAFGIYYVSFVLNHLVAHGVAIGLALFVAGADIARWWAS